MQPVVMTAEILWCYRCQELIDPVHDRYFRHQMKTAVEVGYLWGEVARYELVNICLNCNQLLEEQAKAEQQRKWWACFWLGAIGVNIVLITLWPVGWFPLYALIAGRVVWKWRARRHAAPLLEGHSSQERLRRPGSSTGL